MGRKPYDFDERYPIHFAACFTDLEDSAYNVRVLLGGEVPKAFEARYSAVQQKMKIGGKERKTFPIYHPEYTGRWAITTLSILGIETVIRRRRRRSYAVQMWTGARHFPSFTLRRSKKGQRSEEYTSMVCGCRD